MSTFTVLWIVVLFIYIVFCYKSDDYEKQWGDRDQMKTYLKCKDGEHEIVRKTHSVLFPPKNAIVGVIAMKGTADRDECEKCVHTGPFDVPIPIQEVYELDISPDDYDTFVSSGFILTIDEDSDIIIKEEELEEKDD